jgi:adenylate cyclase
MIAYFAANRHDNEPAMAIEIERKFLLAGSEWRDAVERSERIAQGYLVGAQTLRTGAARASVRVRVSGDRAWLNIKAAVPGLRRAEYDVPMPLHDARAILDTLCDGVIEKVRHHVRVDGLLFEIDEFLGDNQGLIVAEVELRDVDQAIPRPAWLGHEVSELTRYYNVNLIQHPFKNWTAEERAGC